MGIIFYLKLPKSILQNGEKKEKRKLYMSKNFFFYYIFLQFSILFIKYCRKKNLKNFYPFNFLFYFYVSYIPFNLFELRLCLVAWKWNEGKRKERISLVWLKWKGRKKGEWDGKLFCGITIFQSQNYSYTHKKFWFLLLLYSY